MFYSILHPAAKKAMQHLLLLLLTVLTLSPLSVKAATDAECLNCHGDPTLTVKVEGKVKQLYVKGKEFSASVHASNGCVSCHREADVNDFPHPSPMKKVNCGDCHDDIEKRYRSSLHGQAFSRGDRFAAGCSF